MMTDIKVILRTDFRVLKSAKLSGGLQWEIIIELCALDGSVRGSFWKAVTLLQIQVWFGEVTNRARAPRHGTHTHRALRCEELAHMWSGGRSLPVGVFVCHPGNNTRSVMVVQGQQQTSPLHCTSCHVSCNSQHRHSLCKPVKCPWWDNESKYEGPTRSESL